MLLALLREGAGLLWGGFYFPMLFLCAALLAVGTRALPLRRLSRALVLPFSARREERRAAAVSLGSTVGTGNIIGTSQAIAMGGPGALFWIWMAALAGMLVKYSEIALVLRFRQGQRGFGPPDYIGGGLGWKRTARLYAWLALLSAFGMGCLVQMNAISLSLLDAGEMLAGGRAPDRAGFRLAAGLLFAGVTLLLSLRGTAGIDRAAALLVPLMALLFGSVSLALLAQNRQRLPGVFALILRSAFSPRAALGASCGVTLRSCIRWGVRRSAFSHEAGLGTAAIAHADDVADDPAAAALWGVFEVFADTMLVCTLTGLCILCAAGPIPFGAAPEGGLYARALVSLLGGRGAALFLALCVTLFAYTSVLSALRFTLRCLDFLTGGRGTGFLRALFLLAVTAGALLPAHKVWILADSINALLAVPNLTALVLLHRETIFLTRKAFS